jgi:hypothetical protein
MGAARTEAATWLLEQFAADGVAIDVEPYARGIESLPRLTVLLRLDRVTTAPAMPQAARAYVFAFVLVTPLTEAGPADDELDAGLEDLLHAIDKHPLITWETAERAVFESTQTPCYLVTATSYTKPEQPPAPPAP